MYRVISSHWTNAWTASFNQINHLIWLLWMIFVVLTLVLYSWSHGWETVSSCLCNRLRLIEPWVSLLTCLKFYGVYHMRLKNNGVDFNIWFRYFFEHPLHKQMVQFALHPFFIIWILFFEYPFWITSVNCTNVYDFWSYLASDLSLRSYIACRLSYMAAFPVHTGMTWTTLSFFFLDPTVHVHTFTLAFSNWHKFNPCLRFLTVHSD